jgi:hypothetical protein
LNDRTKLSLSPFFELPKRKSLSHKSKITHLLQKHTLKVKFLRILICNAFTILIDFPHFHSFAGSSDDIHEIQRQNRITEQILTNFFERKFFPHRKPRPAPTIDDILPPEPRPNRSNKQHHQTKDEDDDSESDNLQSVESEHVDTFYRTSGE